MRIAKVVLSNDRSEHAVYLDDGSKLECVTAVAVEASVDGGSIATATITVQLIPKANGEVTTFGDSVRRYVRTDEECKGCPNC